VLAGRSPRRHARPGRRNGSSSSNSCPCTQTIRICLKWTSGPHKGVVARYSAQAAKDKLGEITVAPCDTGQFNYTHNEQGTEPDCPE